MTRRPRRFTPMLTLEHEPCPWCATVGVAVIVLVLALAGAALVAIARAL